MWDWLYWGNPIAEVILSDVSEDQRETIRQVLDGMLRERAGGNDSAALTNPVNIGIGIK